MLNPKKDLLINVVEAADPARFQAMVEKLQAARASAESNIDSKPENFANLVQNTSDSTRAKEVRLKSSGEAYKNFEAIVLQNFIEKMFTSDTSHVFGKGQAGKIWRSMLCEAVSKEMAQKGGLGIADNLAKQASLKQNSIKDSSLRANLYTQNIKTQQVADGIAQSLYAFKAKNA